MTAAPPPDASDGPPPLEPLHVNLPRLILAGEVLWVIALVLTLAVPTLHSGDRSWWPWTAVSGVLLGALGLVYLHRGRGNASAQ